MKSFKKIWKLLGLTLLIVLASIGIGFGGGISIPTSNRREEHPIEISVELVESDRDKIEVDVLTIKQ